MNTTKIIITSQCGFEWGYRHDAFQLEDIPVTSPLGWQPNTLRYHRRKRTDPVRDLPGSPGADQREALLQDGGPAGVLRKSTWTDRDARLGEAEGKARRYRRAVKSVGGRRGLCATLRASRGSLPRGHPASERLRGGRALGGCPVPRGRVETSGRTAGPLCSKKQAKLWVKLDTGAGRPKNRCGQDEMKKPSAFPTPPRPS